MAKSWWKMANVAMVRVAIFRLRARLLLFDSCRKRSGGFLVLMWFNISVMGTAFGFLVGLLDSYTKKYIKY